MEDPDTTWALGLVVGRFRSRLTETGTSPFFLGLQFQPMVLVRIRQIQMIGMVEVGPEVLFVFAGNYIINHGTISAKGGTGAKLASGGGGRVAFNFRSGVNKGSVDVGSGSYKGTISENSTPVIINPGVISVKYDNLNYQASATRANDLVLWYKFDESFWNHS